MRLQIRHTTEYRYGEPVSYALQRLRLTPVSGPTQTVIDWQMELSGAKREVQYNDPFGNVTDLISTLAGAQTTSITVFGEVETRNTSGVVGPHTGNSPIWLYQRETPRTKVGKLVRDLARSIGQATELERMHALMAAIHSQLAYKPGATSTETTAEEALEHGHGVCQDHAHVFIAAARVLNMPARYVSGYLLMEDRTEQAASHAWAEALIPGLGWVGFDAANKICPDDRYVKLAVALDYAGAAPVSGMRLGTDSESLNVALTVEGQQQQQSQGSDQSQSQRQTQG